MATFDSIHYFSQIKIMSKIFKIMLFKLCFNKIFKIMLNFIQLSFTCVYQQAQMDQLFTYFSVFPQNSLFFTSNVHGHIILILT